MLDETKVINYLQKNVNHMQQYTYAQERMKAFQEIIEKVKGGSFELILSR